MSNTLPLISFPPDTPVRNGTNGNFQRLQDVHFDEIVLSNTIHPAEKSHQKEEHLQSNPTGTEELMMNTVQDRIAALKQMKKPDQLTHQHNQHQNFALSSRVEDRIKALRNERLSQEQNVLGSKGDDEKSITDRCMPMNSGRNEGYSDVYGNDKAQYPTVPSPNKTGNNDDRFVYPYNEHVDDNDAAYPTVASDSFKNDESGEYPAIGAYPIGDVEAYPVVGKYSVEEDDHAYPNYFGPNISSKENTSFPRDPFSEMDQKDVNVQVVPKKKQFKGDKSILKGLIPSHLHNRRSNLPNNNIGKRKRKLMNNNDVSNGMTRDEYIVLKQAHHVIDKKNERSEQTIKPGHKSVTDDYDKFMEEIAELK